MTKQEAEKIVKEKIIEVLFNTSEAVDYDFIYEKLKISFGNGAGPNNVFVSWPACIKELISDKIIEKPDNGHYKLKTRGLFFPCRIVK